jgi:hypothetical protein
VAIGPLRDEVSIELADIVAVQIEGSEARIQIGGQRGAE